MAHPETNTGLDFVALDLETANADLASICQIGLVTVRAGAIVDTWATLIDPEDFFDWVNVDKHGIDENRVAGAPRFPDIYGEFLFRTADTVVVSHTAFDRTAMVRAAEKYELRAPSFRWLNSARVVRRAWPERYAQKGYGLASVAADLGIDFIHHDALEDARAAAEIMLRASADAGLDIEGWIERLQKPGAHHFFPPPVRREGDPEGPLYGEVLVFTGELDLPRTEAADLAANAGCRVDSGVTKRTTLLVVGDQDARKLAAHEKSTKHRKAEALIEKGQPLRILRESDFRKLVVAE